MLTRDRTATMRTSEAERQRVADFLRDCCAEGRLDPDELEERLDRLFAGGTVSDLRRLVADPQVDRGLAAGVHPPVHGGSVTAARGLSPVWPAPL